MFIIFWVGGFLVFLNANFVNNNPLAFEQIGSSIRQLEQMVQSGASQEDMINELNRGITSSDASLPDFPQVAALPFQAMPHHLSQLFRWYVA